MSSMLTRIPTWAVCAPAGTVPVSWTVCGRPSRGVALTCKSAPGRGAPSARIVPSTWIESPDTTRAVDVIADRASGVGVEAGVDVGVAVGAADDSDVASADWGAAADVTGPDGAGAPQAVGTAMTAPASSTAINRRWARNTGRTSWP